MTQRPVFRRYVPIGKQAIDFRIVSLRHRHRFVGFGEIHGKDPSRRMRRARRPGGKEFEFPASPIFGPDSLRPPL